LRRRPAGARRPRARRPNRPSRPDRAAHVGQQQHRPHQVFGSLRQVGRRLGGGQRRGELGFVFQPFEVFGVEVQVQQRQRLGQRFGVALHQAGKVLAGQREAGNPRQHGVAQQVGLGGVTGFIGVTGGRRRGVVRRKDPRVEPAPRADRFVQRGMAAAQQRQRGRPARQWPGGAGGSAAAGFGLHQRQPVCLGNALRLQQHAA